MNIEIHEVDPTLTATSAGDRGFEWYSDELYGQNATQQQNFGINTEVEQGALIGMPKFEKKEDGYVGLYKKARTINLPKVDWSLNPENANNAGFVWTGDYIMDPEAPDEANEEFVEMMAKGYKFGEPANVNTIVNGFVGVYKPVQK